MARAWIPLAATALFAMLVVPAGLAAPSKDTPGDVAFSSSTGAWVGVVHVSFTSDIARDDGAKFQRDAELDMTAHANRTIAVARRRVRNLWPGECRTLYREEGHFNGPVIPVTVSVGPDKYSVDYLNPMIDVVINEEKQCRQEPARPGRSLVLPVYIRIEGPARRNMTRVSGSLAVHDRYCGVPNCKTAEVARWDLHRVGAISGRGPAGGGKGGRPGAGAGIGCERNVIAGTPLDDRLVGTARNELMLGLAGDDLIRGQRGSDCLFGGPGDDVLLGGPGNDLLVGDAGNDVLRGGAGNDRLIGGPGRNKLIGGKGNDRILARNGQRDAIRCGPGFDIVIADRNDRVAKDCEVVRRR